MAKLLNHTQQKRKDMILAGAYDGRFKERTIINKKKQTSKLWARKGNIAQR